MAAANAPDSLGRTTDRAVLVHRKDEVLAAAWIKSATRPQERAERELIRADTADHGGGQEPGGHTQRLPHHDAGPRWRRRTCNRSAKFGSRSHSSAKVSVPLSAGMRTRSSPTGSRGLLRRNASRKSRLIRLRRTELPKRLPTATPNLDQPRSFRLPKTTSTSSRTLQRLANMASKSRRCRSRSSARSL